MLFAALLAATPTAASSAPAAATPTHSQFDESQQSKLAAWLGAWRCTPVGGGTAETSVGRLRGHYYVTRYAGANSLTAYSRWDPIEKAYYTVRILDAGGVQVFKTASPDPANGVWVAVFPDRIKGRAVETTLLNDRMTWGDMRTVGIDCRKQRDAASRR